MPLLYKQLNRRPLDCVYIKDVQCTLYIYAGSTFITRIYQYSTYLMWLEILYQNNLYKFKNTVKCYCLMC